MRISFSFIVNLIRKAPSALYEYSGSKFIALKFTGKYPNDPQFREPPSGFLWLIGLYLAMFGLASQLYEKRLAQLQADIVAVAEVSELEYRDKRQACSYYPSISIWPDAPVKPLLFRPLTVVQSLFFDYVPTFSEKNTRVGFLIQAADKMVAPNVFRRGVDSEGLTHEIELISGDIMPVVERAPVSAYGRMSKAELVQTCTNGDILNGQLRKRPVYAADFKRIRSCTVEIIARTCLNQDVNVKGLNQALMRVVK